MTHPKADPSLDYDAPHDDETEDQDDRLRCPSCHCEHLPVQYTRHQLGHIMRVRKCRHCGRRVITRERRD